MPKSGARSHWCHASFASTCPQNNTVQTYFRRRQRRTHAVARGNLTLAHLLVCVMPRWGLTSHGLCSLRRRVLSCPVRRRCLQCRLNVASTGIGLRCFAACTVSQMNRAPAWYAHCCVHGGCVCSHSHWTGAVGAFWRLPAFAECSCVMDMLRGLVFFDASQDPVIRRRMWSVVRAMRDERTIVLSTHIMDEEAWHASAALSICSRCTAVVTSLM